MLLNALLTPVPRSLSSVEYQRRGSGRASIDHLSNGNLALVRISWSNEESGTTLSHAYYFLPHGLLVIHNKYGLESRWEDDALFHDKVVPRSITIRGGTRDLLTAAVSIEAAGNVAPELFDLPVAFAEPGQTLRSLQQYEIQMPTMKGDPPIWSADSNDGHTMIGVVDRMGRYRELEFVMGLTGDTRSYAAALKDLRASRWTIPRIDGSPCEYQSEFIYVRNVRFTMSGR
jgi:hypothetical protein